VIIFLTIPQRQVIAPDIVQQGAIEAESSEMTGTSHNAPPGETQQQRRHPLVHRDAAIVATENITQEAYLEILRKTGSYKKKKQHAIGCESIHIDVDDVQSTV